MRTLNAYVKEQRIKKGLSQWDVAKKLGYTTAQFISNIERGICPVGQQTLSKLIKPLDLDRKLVKKMLVKEFEQRIKI